MSPDRRGWRGAALPSSSGCSPSHSPPVQKPPRVLFPEKETICPASSDDRASIRNEVSKSSLHVNPGQRDGQSEGLAPGVVLSRPPTIKAADD